MTYRVSASSMQRRWNIKRQLYNLDDEGDGGRVVLDSVYGSHLTSRNLDNFQSAYNNLKYSKGNKHNKI
jgi:hypothetical protein